MTAEIGRLAPDFELENQFGEKVRLSDFRGKKSVVLVFYPKAFTGICTGELCAIRDRSAEFVSADAITFGISTDTTATLKAFADSQGIGYSLLSDHWPHGAVAEEYGVFLPDRGIANRATFIIDRDGVVRWSVVTSPAQARSEDDYRQALAELV